MKVRALTSFVGHYGDDRKTIVAHEGMEFELPEGVDWLSCGFCEEIDPPKKPPRKRKPRTAVRKPKEKAVRNEG